jgi:hypothetical protein
MTFPQYEAYRHCEASLISQIPEHWESASLKESLDKWGLIRSRGAGTLL